VRPCWPTATLYDAALAVAATVRQANVDEIRMLVWMEVELVRKFEQIGKRRGAKYENDLGQ
jgi:ABC-type branched-subunit amino acid transport system substrate-binding protein